MPAVQPLYPRAGVLQIRLERFIGGTVIVVLYHIRDGESGSAPICLCKQVPEPVVQLSDSFLVKAPAQFAKNI